MAYAEWTAPATGWYERTYDAECYRLIARDADGLMGLLVRERPAVARKVALAAVGSDPEAFAEALMDGADNSTLTALVARVALADRCPRADAVLGDADIYWMPAGKEMLCPVYPEGGCRWRRPTPWGRSCASTRGWRRRTASSGGRWTSSPSTAGRPPRGRTTMPSASSARRGWR